MIVLGIMLCLVVACGATAHADCEGAGIVTASALNLRSQPSEESSVINCLPQGTIVIVNSSLEGWYQVSYNGQSGYMSKDYLTFSQSASGNFGNGTVTGDYVNIRSGPSADCSAVGQVNKGTVLPVTGVNGAFYQVNYNGSTAYISSSYLSLGGGTQSGGTSSEQSSTGETASGTAVIIGDYVRMRAGPGTGYEILGSYNSGDKMELLGKSGDWYNVRSNGIQGYIYAQYLSTSPASNVTPMADTMAWTTTGVYFRQAPSTDSTSLQLLYAGTAVTINGKTGEWYRVLYNGTTGFVYGIYLSTQAPAENLPSTTSAGLSIVTEAKKYLGVRYVYGGTSPAGFDCSGFVYYVYRQCGYSITRTATAQSRIGSQVSRSALQPGDIIIFTNGARSAIGHAGIALGDGRFIHASSGQGRVTISSLSDNYYNTRFYCARRVV